jgi:hypothetical protein
MDDCVSETFDNEILVILLFLPKLELKNFLLVFLRNH